MLDPSMNDQLVRMVLAERLAVASRRLTIANCPPPATALWRQRLGRLVFRIGSTIDPETRPPSQRTSTPVVTSAPAG